MPWTVEDVDEYMKGLSAKGKKIGESVSLRDKIIDALIESEGFEEAVTKSEDGVDFSASDYAYVPDREKSSTWKLRLTSKPGGTPDAGIVGAAVAALGKGFRGQKVQIPTADLPAVKTKVRAAWKKANPDKDIEDMPAIIREAGEPQEATFTEMGELVEVGV